MIFFLLPDYPSIYENVYKPEKKKLMARRLHQYWQFRDKNSRNILRDIWDFFGILIYVYIYIYVYLFICMFIIRFLAEPWLENTALMVD